MNVKAGLKLTTINKVWAVFFAVVLTAFMIVFPEPAFAKTYTVTFISFEQGFDIPEKDMFSHFGELEPSKTYSGEFEIENLSKHEIAFEFGMTDETNPSEPDADVLLDTIKLCLVSNETGSVVYAGSLRGVELEEFARLAVLQPGQRMACTYTLEVPETLPSTDHPLTNEVTWVFKAIDETTDQTLEAPVQGAKTIKPLPKTADLAGKTTVLLACVVVVALVSLAVSRKRYTQFDENNEG